jgi:hypothetical protein
MTDGEKRVAWQWVACEMIVGSLEDERRCNATPTVGGNGLYRYCQHHMRVVAAAGATTLQYDDQPVITTVPPAPRPSGGTLTLRRRCGHALEIEVADNEADTVVARRLREAMAKPCCALDPPDMPIPGPGTPRGER